MTVRPLSGGKSQSSETPPFVLVFHRPVVDEFPFKLMGNFSMLLLSRLYTGQSWARRQSISVTMQVVRFGGLSYYFSCRQCFI